MHMPGEPSWGYPLGPLKDYQRELQHINRASAGSGFRHCVFVCPGYGWATGYLVGLEAALQEAAQPDSLAPAVHGAHAVAAKAQHSSLSHRHHRPLCLQGLRMVFPLPQNPAVRTQSHG